MSQWGFCGFRTVRDLLIGTYNFVFHNKAVLSLVWTVCFGTCFPSAGLHPSHTPRFPFTSTSSVLLRATACHLGASAPWKHDQIHCMFSFSFPRIPPSEEEHADPITLLLTDAGTSQPWSCPDMGHELVCSVKILSRSCHHA